MKSDVRTCMKFQSVFLDWVTNITEAAQDETIYSTYYMPDTKQDHR